MRVRRSEGGAIHIGPKPCAECLERLERLPTSRSISFIRAVKEIHMSIRHFGVIQ